MKWKENRQATCTGIWWNFLPGKLVLAQSQYVASYFSHDFALILGPAVLQHVLDYVVSILVLNQTNRKYFQPKWEEDSWWVWRHVRRSPASVNLEAQREELVWGSSWQPTSLCVFYLHELLCVLMELLQYRQRLFGKAVFENTLDDSAAVWVSGEGKDLQRE